MFSDRHSRPCLHSPRSQRRKMVTAPVVALLLLLFVTPTLEHAQAGDESRELLEGARQRELAYDDFEGAWQGYEEILRIGDLDPNVEAAALMGAARCAERTKDLTQARSYWDRILANEKLPEHALVYAREKIAKATATKPVGMSEDEVSRRVKSQLENQRRIAQADSARKVSSARRMIKRGQYQEARRLCHEALAIDGENEDARVVLRMVDQSRPERGIFLRQILEFLQTSQLEEYQQLKKKVRELQERGRLAFLDNDFAAADQLFRDAINRIDESDFLETGGSLNFDSLGVDREYLVQWMRMTHERGAKAGLTLEATPPMPDLEDRKGGLQAQFYALLAEIFTTRDRGSEPLRFYNFGAELSGGDRRVPLLSGEFVSGQRVALQPSQQSRARWAEQWIRRHVGSGWTDPSRPSVRGPGRSGRGRRSETPSRILTRFGDIIGLQHVEGVQRRVEALRRSFGLIASPMQVDVRVYGATSAGSVQACETLGVRAHTQQRGRSLVADMLIDACADRLREVEGVDSLGSVQIRLRGASMSRLEISHLTERHPMYVDVPAPPLRVDASDARYGLWIDLFAQDLPETGTGQARSALGVAVEVIEPAGSFVIPRSTDDEQPWSRLPRTHTHQFSTNLQLPHFGTLVCLGVPNPFPETRSIYPELIVILGCKPQRGESPDPPSDQPSRVVPDSIRYMEYALGPLSSEINDHGVVEGWPETQAALKAPLAERMRNRGLFLGELISRLAQLKRMGQDPEAPPVLVDNHLATGVLSPDEDIRVRNAVKRIRSHENDLYRIDVRSALVTRAQLDRLKTNPDMQETSQGVWMLDATAMKNVKTFLERPRAVASLFGAQNTLLARATQRVALRSLRERAVLRDLYVRKTTGDQPARYEPIIGATEEGLIVEIRPGLEHDKKRAVTVRARAARLKSIEVRPHPLLPDDPQAVIEVPQWHMHNDKNNTTAGGSESRPLADFLATEDTSDDRAMLIPLAVPGDSSVVIAIYVHVIRVH